MNPTEMRESADAPCTHRPTGGAPFPLINPKPIWNQVLQGDCLSIAISWPKATLDLIYLDPPFFTNREHSSNGRAKTGEPPAKRLSFTDRWKAQPYKAGDGIAGVAEGGNGPSVTTDRDKYLLWLQERITAIRPLLTPTGVFLLHLDWHIVHYAKILCDQIFGDDHFQNELIWYYQTGGASKDRFSRKHDTILLYSNGPTFPFDGKSIAIPRTPKAMKRAKCPTGARIKLTDTHKNPDDVLLVPALNPMANERTGYPTQKPVELLERLIRALTPPTGTVADFCCGSGTTLVAAHRLHRPYIGADQNPAAVTLAKKRLAKQNP